ncbi:MAG: hypothetical protein NTZ87_02475 [Candidatus Nomurabacteria bacterium]|nr:hypothetical protein [Candidatus Nomurabacteria bacterium]
MKSTLKIIVAVMLTALTLNINAQVVVSSGGGGSSVAYATSLITNSAAWSVALLDKRADYYTGDFYAYDTAWNRITFGEFTMKPCAGGVFMITRFLVGGTNEIFIDPKKPLPGFPSIGKTCYYFSVYVNGWVQMSNDKGQNTRYGNFEAFNFKPGDAVNIKVHPQGDRLLLSVAGTLEGNPDDMIIRIGDYSGCYDPYLSSALGQNIFSVWADPIQVPLGSVWDCIITDQSTGRMTTVRVTVGSGITPAVNTGVSGVEVSNDGGVKEVFFASDNSTYLPDQTYDSVSPWADWTAPVKYFNVTVSNGDGLNVETGGLAAFRIYGFKDGILTDLTDLTPHSSRFVNEVYGRTGYTAYQIIVTRIGGSESTFDLSIWKYSNYGGGGFSPITGEPIPVGN